MDRLDHLRAFPRCAGESPHSGPSGAMIHSSQASSGVQLSRGVTRARIRQIRNRTATLSRGSGRLPDPRSAPLPPPEPRGERPPGLHPSPAQPFASDRSAWAGITRPVVTARGRFRTNGPRKPRPSRAPLPKPLARPSAAGHSERHRAGSADAPPPGPRRIVSPAASTRPKYACIPSI